MIVKYVKTECKKCGSNIILDVQDMTKEEAKAKWKEFDNQAYDCPGFHVELGGWWDYWDIENAIDNAYDKNDFYEMKENEIKTDEEYIQDLIEKNGVENIIDGGSNKYKQFELKTIHDFKGLDHLGFGCFKNKEYIFDRMDSPNGYRLYIRRAA